MQKHIDSILKYFGYKNFNKSNNCVLNYIPARETIRKSNKLRLSVCDYVEKIWDQVGETQKVIDNLEKLGVFNQEISSVCEIGAGTGRYMEKVLEKCQPIRYESYETANDWAKWLHNEYDIISLESDGHSLSSTEDQSIDLLHAHGVFVYIPFFDSLRYFKEIDRVTKNNSYVVFDCITYDCLQDGLLEKWIDSKYNYPRLLPEKYIIQFFPKNKYDLLGTFFTKYGQGKSKYFIFRKIK